MGLFNRKKDDLTKYSVSYSEHFRGFKRFPVVVHGNDEAEKNNKKIYQNNLSKSLFEFAYNPNNDFVFIYIDGMIIGTIYDEKMVNLIKERKIEAIHSEPKPGDERLTFFVKYDE